LVFDNLLSNALKYTPSGGAITVAAVGPAIDSVEAGREVTISVADTGPGVPAAFRSRIFDKFFRLEHQQLDDRRHPRGAGIGLYVCRQIVELHGGRIGCSVGPNNRGASIEVELPVNSVVAVPAVDAVGV
jgi:signal transduction histidine kinase